MGRARRWLVGSLGAPLLASLLAAPGHAQPRWIGFRGAIGHEWLSGEIGIPLSGDTRNEWTVMLFPCQFLPCPAWPLQARVGAGLSRVTYGLDAAWQSAVATNAHSEHWNHVRWHLMAGIEWTGYPLVPYAELRWMRGRLRSQTHLYWPITADPPRETPYDEWGVGGFDQVLGLRTDFGTLFELDFLVRWGDFNPRNVPRFDLSTYALGVRNDGSTFGVQLGVFWYP